MGRVAAVKPDGIAQHSYANLYRATATLQADELRRQLPQARTAFERKMIRAAIAQADANAMRATSQLREAVDVAPDRESRAMACDALASMYVSLDRIDDAEKVLKAAPKGTWFDGLLEASRSVVQARKGLPFDRPSIPDDTLVEGRIVGRIALALFYARDYYGAKESALDSRTVAATCSDFRTAAAAALLLYVIAHSVELDSVVAADCARETYAFGSAARNASVAILGAVGLFELGAETGSEEMMEEGFNLLSRHEMPTQYRERFAFGIARAIRHGWEGEFSAAIGVLDVLGVANRLPGEELLLVALRALLLTPSDPVEAKRLAATVLGQRLDAAGTAFERHHRFIARILGAGVRAMTGDRSGAARFTDVKMHRLYSQLLPAAIEPNVDWRATGQRIRGYARLCQAVHEALPKNEGFTPTEMDIIRMLCQGMRPREMCTNGRSEATVRWHMKTIASKLHARGAIGIVAEVRRRGIV